MREEALFPLYLQLLPAAISLGGALVLPGVRPKAIAGLRTLSFVAAALALAVTIAAGHEALDGQLLLALWIACRPLGTGIAGVACWTRGSAFRTVGAIVGAGALASFAVGLLAWVTVAFQWRTLDHDIEELLMVGGAVAMVAAYVGEAIMGGAWMIAGVLERRRASSPSGSPVSPFDGAT